MLVLYLAFNISKAFEENEKEEVFNMATKHGK